MSLAPSGRIKFLVTGARGATFADVSRASGSFGSLPTDTDAQVNKKFADYAIQQNPNFKGDVGDRGPNGYSTVSLQQLKEAPVTDGPLNYDGAVWEWRTSNAPYVSDEGKPFVTTVASDDLSLNVGAWTRQPADKVAYKAPKPATRTRPTSERLAEDPSTGDYDTRYAPLGFDNGPAIQQAIDDYAGYASNIGQTVYMQAGLLRTDTPIRPSDYASLIGQGKDSTIFYREQDPTTKPCIEQVAGQQGFQTLKGFGIRGYGFGEHVAGAVDGFRRSDIKMLGCDVGFQFDSLLQTSVFENIEIFQSRKGFRGLDFVNNRVTLRDVDFKNTADTNLELGGAEDFVVEGGRFEAGGAPNAYTIDAKKVRSLHFDKGYMESTHEYALRLIDSEKGVVSFSNFHWTGTGAQAGGGLGYKFATDGSGRIVFHNCEATYPMYVPYNALMEGSNPGLIPRMFSGRLPRKRVSPTGPVTNLVGFRRFNTSNSPTNTTALRGTLYLNYIFGSADGGVAGAASSEYSIFLYAQGSGNVTVVIKKNANNSNSFGSGEVIELISGSDPGSAIIVARLNDLTFGNLAFANYTFDLTWDQTSSMDDGLFAIGDGY